MNSWLRPMPCNFQTKISNNAIDFGALSNSGGSPIEMIASLSQNPKYGSGCVSIKLNLLRNSNNHSAFYDYRLSSSSFKDVRRRPRRPGVNQTSLRFHSQSLLCPYCRLHTLGRAEQRRRGISASESHEIPPQTCPVRNWHLHASLHSCNVHR